MASIEDVDKLPSRLKHAQRTTMPA
ncbi:hypothetical protein Aduo_016497 [Ancylostoma duodenale]